jgi:hypothetical protein
MIEVTQQRAAWSDIASEIFILNGLTLVMILLVAFGVRIANR